ncbi:hypothetical protein BD310DRAFT_915822 [Dichomitus squalens]|uniref:F-box domain-containing protein n=1 Tax=Dichomitus squalens TaxID=114155 RepID=A0A4V2K9F8_9APHY|nr:hypothetical protein BD310DRAFT_915822 [Dichomitus squalens]
MDYWKTPFRRGIESFQAGKYDLAIASFSESLKHGGDPGTICDSRAAVYQKMGKLKEALRDSKTVIDSQPSRWQGYARSARLFHHIRKFDAASRMIDLALERIPSHQSARRDEMLALRGAVDSAREEATKEAAKLVSQRACHFGKLPVEIANTIFSFLLADDHAYVVVLAQVCQNWRFTILGTPAFWSILVLTERHPARKIRVWKERSKNRIRELALTEDFSLTPSVLEELDKLSLNSLVTLRLDNFPITHLPANLPSIGGACLQALRGLRRADVTLLKGRLQWHGKTPVFSPSVLNLNSRTDQKADWTELSNSLTDLEEGYFYGAFSQRDWHNALWLFHRNVNLAHLEIRSWYPVTTLPPPTERELPPTILFPKLTSLKISLSLPGALLARLAFPSLTTLEISGCPPPSVDHALRHLADGNAPKLTSLAIRNSTCDPQLMIRVLAATPLLETLELSYISTVKAVLEALTRAPDPQPVDTGAPHEVSTGVLCPVLRHLDCSRNDAVSGGELVRLVKMRIAEAEKCAARERDDPGQSGVTRVQPLQTLIADGCPNLDSDVLPWLREKVPSVSCVYMTKKAAAWKR